MQSIPSLPSDPGLLFMVLCACVGILSLLTGSTIAMVAKRWAELKAIATPLLALALTLAIGRVLQGFHLPIMCTIVGLAAWSTTRTTGKIRMAAILGTAGLSSAILTAVLLF
jgi:hypothetical protein